MICYYNNLSFNDFNVYETEITHIISNEDTQELYNIVITDKNSQPIISNLENDFADWKALSIVSSYNRQNNEYIERINLKGGRNQYGVRDNVGYIYFQRHPDIISEIEKNNLYIWIAAIVFSILITTIALYFSNLLLKNFTLAEIIANGESNSIEFKPSFFTNTNLEGDRALEYECAKVISSFLNTNGGYLLIGVNDDGNIKGIDDDIKYLKQKPISINRHEINWFKDLNDEYIRKVKAKLSKTITKRALSSLKFRIIETNFCNNYKISKILVIKCPPLPQPTFTKKKQGTELYFRHGTVTVKYDAIRENTINNQIFPLWKVIILNFSLSRYLIKKVSWSIKNFIVQI